MIPPIGRLYRYPGSTPLPRGANNGVILPEWDDVIAKIHSGEWIPSITNILDVRNSPHLINWAARESAKTAISMEQSFPGRLTQNPAGALRYLSTSHDRIRDNSADVGTRVHYACELIANNETVPEHLLKDNEWGYVRSWEKWRKDFSPEFLHTETTVFGSTEFGNYAGTTDFICRINGVTIVGDIKTTRSGIHDDVAYQLAAATHTDNCSFDGETLVDLPKLEAAYVLHLSSKGYTFSPLDTGEESWQMFKAARSMWNLHALGGIKPDGSSVIKHPVKSPTEVVPLF